MRTDSNNFASVPYASARGAARAHRKAGRRPAVFSLCAAAGAAVLVVCLHTGVKFLWALATAGFFTFLLALGLTFLWAITSGIERMRE